MLAGTLQGDHLPAPGAPAPTAGPRAGLRGAVVTGRARDMILDPEETGRLHEVIREGEYYGMQTFDQSLFEHVTAGRVSAGAAMEAALEPARLQADARGRRSPAARLPTTRPPRSDPVPIPAGTISRDHADRVPRRRSRLHRGGSVRSSPPRGSSRASGRSSSSVTWPGAVPVQRTRALTGRHQPAHALAPPAGARGGGHHRAPRVSPRCRRGSSTASPSKGRDLVPIVDAMRDYGSEWRAATARRPGAPRRSPPSRLAPAGACGGSAAAGTGCGACGARGRPAAPPVPPRRACGRCRCARRPPRRPPRSP